MRLNAIKSRTQMKIYTKENKSLDAEYIENENETIFSVRNQEMYENIEDYDDTIVDVTIFAEDKMYKAQCRVAGRNSIKRVYDTVVLELESELKEESRRSSTRHDLRVKVTIYEYSIHKAKFHKGNYICETMSSNISVDGISLLSMQEINVSKDEVYTLEFSIKPNSVFSYYLLPSTIVKVIKDDTTWTYEYVFTFDLAKTPEVQKKLLDDIFAVKLL